MYAFKNSSLTKEQLTSLGVTSSKDAHQNQTQAPLFPPLHSKPIEIKNSTKLEFQTLWLDGFRSRLFDIHSNSETVSADSFSSKVAVALEKEHKKKLQFKFAWSQMPQELRPQASKRKLASSNKIIPKKPNLVEKEKIDAKLQILEEKEKDERDDDKSDKDSEEEDNVEIEHEEDNELDQETDYLSNYFDNGEGDDDDGDDGPVY